MKALVSIATFGTKNQQYLYRVLNAYQSFQKYNVDVIVHGTDSPSKEGITFIKHIDPPNTVFFHRQDFVDAQDDYDLFIFSEDDILIPEVAVDTCVKYNQLLPSDCCCGLLRFEQTPENTKYFVDLWLNIPGYSYINNSCLTHGRSRYFTVSNPHQACYILTRDKLKWAISNSNFLPADTSAYGLETAASGIFADWYLKTGNLYKLLPLDKKDLQNCFIEHLPGNHCNPPGVNHAPEVFRSNTVTEHKLYNDLILF